MAPSSAGALAIKAEVGASHPQREQRLEEGAPWLPGLSVELIVEQHRVVDGLNDVHSASACATILA
jgi:hypothetical protein